MIRAKALHHAAIIVTDLEIAKSFYRDVLQLQEITRPPFNFPGAWYGVGDDQIHLIVYKEALATRGTRTIDTRDAHLALRVASFSETVAHLEEMGVECVARPDSITGWGQIYVSDPDGNVIELNAEQGS